MNLLEPLGLLGLGATLPILALYFLKLKREERVVPSTLLWKKTIEDLHVNAPFQRLRYSLLLLLQLLLILLLAFALSRPYLTLAAVPDKQLLLLIDTSASMQTIDATADRKRTRLQEAVADAKKMIDLLGRDSEVQLIAFDSEVRQLTPLTKDKLFVKKKLDELETRDLSTNATAAFETALSIAGAGERIEVYVLSDGCFDALSLEKILKHRQIQGNTEDMEQGTLGALEKFRFMTYGREQSDNVGITDIGARTRLVRATDVDGMPMDALETQIFVMVENFRATDVDVILNIATASMRFEPKVIKLQARGRNTAQRFDAEATGNTDEVARSQEVFRLPLDTVGLVTATIVSPADSFSLDNQVSIVVGQTEGTKVLLVGDENYFLQKAFQAVPEFAVTRIAATDYEPQWQQKGLGMLEDFDAVFFDHCAPQEWPDGGAIFFGALPPLPEFRKNEAQPVLEWPELLDWDTSHDVMRYVSFRNIQIAEAQGWIVPKSFKLLVEAIGGPLVVASESDRLRVVALSFSLLKSDWPYRASLPLFIRNAIPWVAEASPRRRVAATRTGEPLILPPLQKVQTIVLTRPDGRTQSVPVSSQRKTYVKEIDKAGLYRVADWPDRPGESRVFAVNLANARESDNRARSELEVDDKRIETVAAAERGQREIWRIVALLAIGLLLSEWLIYHRRIGI